MNSLGWISGVNVVDQIQIIENKINRELKVNREPTLGYQRENRGRTNWEIGIDIYTLLSI